MKAKMIEEGMPKALPIVTNKEVFEKRRFFDFLRKKS